MTTTLNLTRTRGDTYPIRMTMTNPDGTAMDLTNKQVLLTVNTEEDPADTTNQVFQIVGTITDALLGKVEFAPTDDQADNVGTFYYDVEVSDVANPVYVWTPDAGVTVGAQVPNDGSEVVVPKIFAYSWAPDVWTRYVLVDGRLTVSSVNEGADEYYQQTLHGSGVFVPMSFGIGGYIEVTVKCLTDGWATLNYLAGADFGGPNVGVGGYGFGVQEYGPDLVTGKLLYSTYPTFDSTGMVDGWYNLGIRLNEDRTMSVKIQPEGDAEEWHVRSFGNKTNQTAPFLPLYWRITLGGYTPASIAAVSSITVCQGELP